jgi:ATP-dependent DNA helicase DinG
MTENTLHIENQQQLKQCLANIAENLPNFKARPTQQEMIQQVLITLMNTEAFDKRNTAQLLVDDIPLARTGESILAVEGPTGTGKSLGYLLPAIIAAKSLKKHLIISSATVILQEQLAQKDIPFIAKHAGIPITHAIAKGRSRYSCTQKLYRFGTRMPQSDMLGFDDDESIQQHPDRAESQLLSILADAFEQKTWSGDKDSLPIKLAEKTWNKITNDRHGCVKRTCPHFKTCPFFEARGRLQEVDVIIANHDLLLADLNMGGGAILTPPDDTFYCIDEGHHLADKAIKQFAASHNIYGALTWLEKLPTTVGKIETLLGEFWWLAKVHSPLETIVENFQNLSLALGDFFPAEKLSKKEANIFRAENGRLPSGFQHYQTNLLPALRTLLSILSSIRDSLKRHNTNTEEKSKQPAMQKFNVDMGFYVARVENLLAVWTLFSTETHGDAPPIAKWIIADISQKNIQIEYTLSASPISAATLLAERFFSKASGIILTSATLRSLGSFEKFLSDTGLTYFADAKCLALPSPFDLQKQGLLVIPEMKSEPTNPVAHTNELIELLPDLLKLPKGEGALVLFSSKKQMLETAAALPKNIKDLLLIQGSATKDALLNQHFTRIENKESSILFGLASFAEGLDLPGKACSQLIIAKLPFAVPDDPVSQTRADWITAQGGNPFMQMSLPETSTKLIQAVGRLIRNETDKGMVAILDRRLVSKSYGRLLRKDLPPFRVVIDQEVVVQQTTAEY